MTTNDVTRNRDARHTPVTVTGLGLAVNSYAAVIEQLREHSGARP